VPKRYRTVIPLAALLLALPVMAGEPAGLEERLGIKVYPGAELRSLEGPVTELVDLQRPEWEYVRAEVLVADFLVADPIVDLRRFYRPLCTRDKQLLLVALGVPEDLVVSVRYAGRHPLLPNRRWLRIVTYRRLEATAQGDGE